MSASHRSALIRLIGDVDEFDATHWGRSPLHRTTGDRLEDVLNAESFGRWLATCPRRPTVRLVRDGANVAEHRYCRATRLGSQTLRDVVDHDAVLAEFGRGATVVGQSLHRVISPVADFATALERDLTHRVQVNAYLSPRGAAGLTPHTDGHHVIAVQLDGRKRWDIEGIGTVTMAPGDRFYLPAGTRHSATTGIQPSLHLTIGVHPITRRALVTELLRSSDCLDTPLPIGFARRPPAEQQALAADCLADARALLAGDPPDPSMVARLAPRPRRHRRRGFLAAFEAAAVADGYFVRVRSGIDCGLRADADRVHVTFEGRTISLPLAARPAIEQLLVGRPVEVSALADLDPASRRVVARRLVEEGLLEVVSASER